MRRENRPCEGGIAEPRVNWKPNWELEQGDVQREDITFFTVHDATL